MRLKLETWFYPLQTLLKGMPVSEQQERQWLQAAQKGNQQAFKELVRYHRPAIAATVIGMLGPGPEADEVGQDVFLRFYQKMQDFRAEAQLRTYLTRIAINRCLDILRKRKRQRHQQLSTADRQIADQNNYAEQQANRQWVQQGLLALEPNYRAVVVLRLLEGYSTKETAELLDIPEGTVLSRLSRGQDKLRTILEKLR